MEFTITKEFIIEAHKAACSDWKNRIEKEFPEAFKSKIQVGKWYKGNRDFTSLIYIKKTEKISSYNVIHYYGFTNGEYSRSNTIANTDHEISLVEATKTEVEQALIAEAKKRFGNDWKNTKIKSIDGYEIMLLNKGEFFCEFSDGRFWNKNGILFKDGIWAEILEEKTVITKEKALKILAKKLKVSPENIEIQ